MTIIDPATKVSELGKCGVCSIVFRSSDLAPIPNLSKVFSLLACPECRLPGEKIELDRRIRAIKAKYHEINWFSYRRENKPVEGHSFIFKNGDVISIYHSHGNCSLDELLRIVNSDCYDGSISISTEGRRDYYKNSATPYPVDPFSATNWW